MNLSKEVLDKLYLAEKKSVPMIAKDLKCSESKVNYWLRKFSIPKRSISEAIYIQHNPKGDPFFVHTPQTLDEATLLGLGLGLYWGEGTKSNKYSIRLGNTDPKLLKKFIEFLIGICDIKKNKLKFGLQIFSDMDPKTALSFWQKTLKIPSTQFQKIVITPARGKGTYHKKTKHGVVTIYYHNKKLRDLICQTIEGME